MDDPKSCMNFSTYCRSLEKTEAASRIGGDNGPAASIRAGIALAVLSVTGAWIMIDTGTSVADLINAVKAMANHYADLAGSALVTLGAPS